MNIDPLSNSTYVQQARTNGRSNSGQAPVSSDQDGDTVSTGVSGQIRSTLQSMPEVRPEVVERGRQLLADKNYPSQEIVEKIARLITPLSEE